MAQTWELEYLYAALEVDSQNMASRIGAVSEAVAEKERLRSSDHHAERRNMDAPLEILNGLEDETRVWPLVGKA